MKIELLKQHTNAHEEGIWCSSFTTMDDCETLLTGSVDEKVLIWKVENNELVDDGTLPGHNLGVISIAINQCGKYAATSALDSNLRILELAERSTLKTFEVSPSESWTVAFHPEQELFAVAGGTTGQVSVWSLEGKQEGSMTLPVSEDAKAKKAQQFILSVAYSPDGTKLAAGGMDGTVAIFDTVTHNMLLQLKGHFKPVRGLQFTKDGKGLFTACDDQHSHHYDVGTGDIIEDYSGADSWVTCVATHPDDQTFVCGSSDAVVRQYDYRKKEAVQEFGCHTDQVWSVSISGDGKYMASVSDDKSIALYSCTA